MPYTSFSWGENFRNRHLFCYILMTFRFDASYTLSDFIVLDVYYIQLCYIFCHMHRNNSIKFVSRFLSLNLIDIQLTLQIESYYFILLVSRMEISCSTVTSTNIFIGVQLTGMKLQVTRKTKRAHVSSRLSRNYLFIVSIFFAWSFLPFEFYEKVDKFAVTWF